MWDSMQLNNEFLKEIRTIPNDLVALLRIIHENGNRITQRELRKKSPYISESRISVMLADLEERGLIIKFKHGRGNVIRIADIFIKKERNSSQTL
jgi:uncharacterized membrane protein